MKQTSLGGKELEYHIISVNKASDEAMVALKS
jgi:hypothetical protein